MVTLKLRLDKTKTIDELEKFFEKKFGANISYSFSLRSSHSGHKKCFALKTLEVAEKKRRMGYGTKFMLDICAYADYNDLRIELLPVPLDKEIELKRLERFYRRFGFRYVKKSSSTMFRNPKSSKVVLTSSPE